MLHRCAIALVLLGWALPASAQPVRGCTVVLKADPNAPGGYYILTSYPS